MRDVVHAEYANDVLVKVIGVDGGILLLGALLTLDALAFFLRLLLVVVEDLSA